MRIVTCVLLLAALSVAGFAAADEPSDTRMYWVCEGGWFAKTRDGAWYELNEQTYRKLGKPARFREVRRTKEYVELYDEGRKVAVRLFEAGSEVRLSEREDGAWEKLYSGRWKTPTPEE